MCTACVAYGPAQNRLTGSLSFLFIPQPWCLQGKSSTSFCLYFDKSDLLKECNQQYGSSKILCKTFFYTFAHNKIFAQSKIFAHNKMFAQSKIFTLSKVFAHNKIFANNKIFAHSKCHFSYPCHHPIHRVLDGLASDWFLLSIEIVQSPFYHLKEEMICLNQLETWQW